MSALHVGNTNCAYSWFMLSVGHL